MMTTSRNSVVRECMRHALALIILSVMSARAEVSRIVSAEVDEFGRGIVLSWRFPGGVVSYADADEYSDALDAAAWQPLASPDDVEEGSVRDAGAENRVAPGELTSGMRFYKLSRSGADAAVVYVARLLTLEEGLNFISLWMRPDNSTVAGVFGTKRLPSGAGPADSTVISFYDPATNATPRPVFLWLSRDGTWQYSTGGVADNEPIPSGIAFSVTIPAGAGPQRLLTVGRVPDRGEIRRIAGDPKSAIYNFVGFGVPCRVRMADSGLREAGLRSGVNVGAGDEIRVLAKSSVETVVPKARIFLNEREGGKYWFGFGGQGSADQYAIEPDQAIIIIRRHGEPLTNWVLNLPYTPPGS